MTSAEHRKPAAKNKSAAVPITLALICLLCFLLLSFLFLWRSEKLVALGLAGHFYYFVLLPMGLFAGLALFSGEHAYARLQGDLGAYKVDMRGPVAVFFFVPILGFSLLAMTAATFAITVFVHGAGGKQDLILRSKGTVWLTTGGIRRPSEIDMNGEAFFPEVSPTFRGLESPIGLDAPGYELANPNQTVRLNPGAAYIEVRRKSGHISGHVRREDGSPFSGASISVAGINVVSGQDGSFAVTIPASQLDSALQLQARAEGYEVWTGFVTPDSNDAVVTMVRKR